MNATTTGKHLDRDPAEGAEGRRRQDLLDRANAELPGTEVEHMIRVGQCRIAFVRDEHDRGWVLVATPINQTSAWAMRMRCCSPPESTLIGMSASLCAPTSARTSSMRRHGTRPGRPKPTGGHRVPAARRLWLAGASAVVSNTLPFRLYTRACAESSADKAATIRAASFRTVGESYQTCSFSPPVADGWLADRSTTLSTLADRLFAAFSRVSMKSS